jgi:hypothetical protein
MLKNRAGKLKMPQEGKNSSKKTKKSQQGGPCTIRDAQNVSRKAKNLSGRLKMLAGNQKKLSGKLKNLSRMLKI